MVETVGPIIVVLHIPLLLIRIVLFAWNGPSIGSTESQDAVSPVRTCGCAFIVVEAVAFALGKSRVRSIQGGGDGNRHLHHRVHA